MTSLHISFIASQLGKAKRVGQGWSCLCPAHDDHNPSLHLSLDQETSKILAKCWAGCSFANIMAALRNRGLLEEAPFKSAYPTCILPKAPDLPKGENKRICQIWRETLPAEGSFVETYLKGRGYNGRIPRTIRFHPRLFHTSRTYHPAMVAIVTKWPDKTPWAVHRTYLTADGLDKAALEPNKMMLGTVGGGAVRFSAPGSQLILAEGIETALSCFYATSIPTWACLSTSGMVNVVIPSIERTQEIIICADGDMAGKRAATQLAERLHRTGYRVRIATPPQGQDFNDVLRGKA